MDFGFDPSGCPNERIRLLRLVNRLTISTGGLTEIHAWQRRKRRSVVPVAAIAVGVRVVRAGGGVVCGFAVVVVVGMFAVGRFAVWRSVVRDTGLLRFSAVRLREV